MMAIDSVFSTTDVYELAHGKLNLMVINGETVY